MLHEEFISAVNFFWAKFLAGTRKQAVLAIHALHIHQKDCNLIVCLPQHAQENCILFHLVQKYLVNETGISHSRSALSHFCLFSPSFIGAILIFILSFFLCKNINFLLGLELWRGAEQAGRAACRDQSTQSVPCTRVKKQDLRNAGQCLSPVYQSPEAGPQKYRSVS